MNRQYLESFNQTQLQNYLLTLKRSINDLKTFNISLGTDNNQLAKRYEVLVQLKRQQNQKRKKEKGGFGNLINIGKKKIGSIFHEKQKQQNTYEPASDLHVPQKIQVAEETLQPKVQSPQKQKKITINNFEFDDIYRKGKDKLVSAISKGGDQIKNLRNKFVNKYIKKEEEDGDYEIKDYQVIGQKQKEGQQAQSPEEHEPKPDDNLSKKQETKIIHQGHQKHQQMKQHQIITKELTPPTFPEKAKVVTGQQPNEKKHVQEPTLANVRISNDLQVQND